MIGPLLLSLWVSLLATSGALVLGVPLARLLARSQGPVAELVSVGVLLPMVLPPTAVGYGLLVVVGRSSALGQAWEAVVGAPLVFSPAAAVLAAFLAALPFLVRSSQAAFEAVDPAFEEVARTLGRSELSVFLTVTVPLAWRGIAAGTALAFARAMGEFGATVMVAGSIPGRTRTASVAIYDAVQGGQMQEAGALALALAAVCAGVLLLVGRRGR